MVSSAVDPVGIVLRPRISASIDAAQRFGIAIIIAPAGYGKTEAIEQAFGTFGLRVDLSAAVGAASVARAIVQAAFPEATRALSQQLRKTGDDSQSAVVRWLVKRLRSVEAPIILDDFQRINADPSAREFVARLIEASAPRTRWIIASRETPDLPLGTWIAANWMTLPLTAAELAFTAEEARELSRAMSLKIADSDVDQIVSDADGWPIVVRLILNAWNGTRGLPTTRIRSNALLFDFIQSQIWDGTTNDDRALLLATALAPSASPDVLTAVGFSHADAALETLSRRAPLIRSTTSHGYRLHDLFREFILERFDDEPLRLELLAKLTRVFQELGQPVEALDIVVRAGAQILIIDVLGKCGVALIEDGQRDAVSAALAALGPALSKEVVPRALRALLRAADGSVDTADAELRILPKETLPINLAKAIALTTARFALNRGENLIALADCAPLIDDENVVTMIEARVYSAGAYASLGKTNDAKAMLSRVKPLMDAVPIEVRGKLYARIATAQAYMRSYIEAEQSAQLAVEFATYIESVSTIAAAYCTLYYCAYWVYADQSRSAEYAARWLVATREWGDRAQLAYALLTNVTIAAEQADDQNYRTLLEELWATRFRLPSKYDLPLRWHRAIYEVGNGRARDAATMMSQCSVNPEWKGAQEFVDAMTGLLWAMSGDSERAAQALGPLPPKTNTYQADEELVLFGSAYHALASWMIGQSRRAEKTFPSIPRGAPERHNVILGCMRSIVYSPFATMTSRKLELLLGPLVAQGYAGHARFLSHAFVAHKSPILTPSELRVLNEVRKGRSSQSIAESFGRSPRTIEFHIESACRKIGCSGREAAALYAADQGWI